MSETAIASGASAGLRDGRGEARYEDVAGAQLFEKRASSAATVWQIGGSIAKAYTHISINIDVFFVCLYYVTCVVPS